MITQIVEVAPTNKAHTTEHKSISDYSFYGIVNQIQKELSEGWQINNQEYPIFTGTLYTVAFKRVKELSATTVPLTTVKAPTEHSEGTPAVKTASVRRAKAVTTKVVAKTASKVTDKPSKTTNV